MSHRDAAADVFTVLGERLLERRVDPTAGEIPDALATADVVITGEGRFDATSLGGKVVGHVLGAASCRVIVIAGSIATDWPVSSISLESLAGSPESARTDTERWLRVAGARAPEIALAEGC